VTQGRGSVMVLSAASGAGHVRAAEALVSAFAAAGRKARHVEVLGYTNPLFRKIYADLYVELVNRRPHLLGCSMMHWTVRGNSRSGVLPWTGSTRVLSSAF